MGSNNSAANAASAADQARQSTIQQSIGQIQKAYSSPQRQAQYDQYGKQLGNYYTGNVNEQMGVNARNLKFAMARSGLSGGSATVDGNTQLQKDYTKGLLQASQAAQGGVSALKQADLNSENQLTSLAAQGAYTGAIPQQASMAQSANLQNAGNYTNTKALGDLFTGTAQIYNNNQTAAANRRAQINPIGSIYGTSPTTANVWG